jgi:hypothetical protein
MLLTQDQESYLLSIEYGPYTFSALSFLGDTERRLFFDYSSVASLISIAIENAITEYDVEKTVLQALVSEVETE